MSLIELLGYAASIMVAISLTMKNVLKLRIINLIGSFLFVVYGITINAIPVILTNVFIVGVNIYFLVGMLKQINDVK